jgi:uncharacterized protein YoxC
MTIALSIAAIIAAVGILLLGVSATRFIQIYTELVEQVQTVFKVMLNDIQKHVKSSDLAPDFLPDWLTKDDN